MQFLDAIGLASFWEKIKDWSNSNFFSKRGGEITPTSGLHYIIDGEQLTVSKSGDENETIDIFTVDENGMEAIKIVRTEGTATQVLMADGSIKTLGLNNGIATLDSNGYVPLAQLGNLDTTVAEVVTALPTTNIKKHIYLIKDASGVSQNQYEEYIYTGDTSATYDASKWEKLGDFRATVDLADYYTKSQVDNIANGKSSTSHTHSVIINGITKTIAASEGTAVDLGTYLTSHQSLTNYATIDKAVSLSGISLEKEIVNTVAKKQSIKFLNVNGNNSVKVSFEDATEAMAGFMSANDKSKLNSLDMSDVVVASVDVSSLVSSSSMATVSSSASEMFIILPTVGNENLNFDLKQATTSSAGVMSAADKTKLDGIPSGATADSAIPISVIDALN
jgi:hypothetical protein